MVAPAPQNFANHRRYDPPWHFAGVLIVAAGVVVAIVHAVRHPQGFWNWWFAVYAIGVLLCIGRARSHVTTVQNRVIRLEMRQRLKDVLAPSLAARIGELSVSQLIGLRFASDAELPALVDRCLKGELVTGEAVKKEIKNWQADWLRA